jgi:hypothetical protein
MLQLPNTATAVRKILRKYWGASVLTRTGTRIRSPDHIQDQDYRKVLKFTTGVYSGVMLRDFLFGSVLGLIGVLFSYTTLFMFLMSDCFELIPHHVVARYVPNVQFV